jgi:16S rRNA G527 N7-methylase RsmG
VSPGLIESERLRQKEEMLKAYFERIEQVARVTNLIAAKTPNSAMIKPSRILVFFGQIKK